MNVSGKRPLAATAIAGLFLQAACLLGMGTAAAQSAAVPVPEWQQKAVHGDWGVMCPATGSSRNACQAMQTLETKTDQQQPQRVLRLIAQKGPEGWVMSFELPFGLDLRPGMVFQVDGKDEVKLPFLTCLPGGCIASLSLTSDQQKEFSGGKAMKVGFRPLGSDRVAVVEVSLKGFDKAIKAIETL